MAICVSMVTLIQGILQEIDADEFDRTIGGWLLKNATGCAVAIDGKAIRGYDDNGVRFHLLSAVVHKEGIVLNQKKVDARISFVHRSICPISVKYGRSSTDRDSIKDFDVSLEIFVKHCKGIKGHVNFLISYLYRSSKTMVQ